MTAILILLAALMFCFVGWLISQSVNVQPWVASTSAGTPVRPQGIQAHPDTKVALVVLIAVLSSLFALFMSAYLQRMDLADWRPVQEPDLLWLNTGLLLLGSGAMHWSFIESRKSRRPGALGALAFSGVCLVLFIVGQMLAWRQLSELGYLVVANPANAFFYLITGLHALHILGGLVAWTRTLRKAKAATNIAEIQLNVQLCGIYIHFLLVVWLVLFALLLRT